MTKSLLTQLLENYNLNPEAYHAEIFQGFNIRIVHWNSGLQAVGESSDNSFVANFKDAYQNMVQLMLDVNGKILDTLK